MTNWILPPRLLAWPKTLEQRYNSQRTVGLVSGSSFTSATNQMTLAASWPGYLYERCGLESVIDLSYPQMNNQYIGDSIIDAVESMTPDERNNVFVTVMWNGISHTQEKNNESDKNWPAINGKIYDPTMVTGQDISAIARQDYEIICKTGDYLMAHNVPYAFTFYANILFPPLLPTADGLKKFYKNIKPDEIKKIQSYNLIPSDQKLYLYDYTFFNDQFDDDGYHPDIQARLSWTDRVLLPELVKLGIIQSN
jgi:hypothetical protein